MKSTIMSTGGRAISGSARSDAASAFDNRKIRRRLPEDLVRLAQLPVLSLERPHLLGHRSDRLPARSVLTRIVEDHAHGALADLSGKLVRRLAR
nr:hypothetical protein [Tropicimonas sp. IMCC34011]